MQNRRVMGLRCKKSGRIHDILNKKEEEEKEEDQHKKNSDFMKIFFLCIFNFLA